MIQTSFLSLYQPEGTDFFFGVNGPELNNPSIIDAWAQDQSEKQVLNGTYALDGTGTNAYVLTLAGLTYFDKLKIHIGIQNTNTGPVTVNLNGLGTRNVKLIYGGTKYNLYSKALKENNIYLLQYDGTDFILITVDDPLIEYEGTLYAKTEKVVDGHLVLEYEEASI